MVPSAVALALATLLGTAAALHCAALSKQYNNTGPGRHVFRGGEPVSLPVFAGGGGARAAAALLAELLRRVLGYAGVERRPQRASVCQLAALPYGVVPVAVAAPLDRGACGRRVGDVSWLAPAAAPLTLRTHAHLTHTHAHTAHAMACRTPFSAAPAEVSACEFATITDVLPGPDAKDTETCVECTAILARNESEYDRRVLAAMQNVLGKNYRFRSYSSDSLFRREMLRHRNLTYLFLDEDIWTGDPDVNTVQMPYCDPDGNNCSSLDKIEAVRVGDGDIMRKYAPPISRAVSSFAPTMQNLREILKYEAEDAANDIEEAACLWASRHKSEITRWLFSNYNSTYDVPVYKIYIYFCKDDVSSDYTEVVNIISDYIEINIRTVAFQTFRSSVNCDNADEVNKAITMASRNRMLAAVVMWDRAGELDSAVRCAAAWEVPLVPAGAPAGRGAPALARALAHFLRESQWTRFAILSDGSKYAKNLSNMLMSYGHFNVYEVIVSAQTIRSELQNLRKQDARVFFVNADWNVTAEVLCNAVQLGMESADIFAWIVRDWRITECNGTQSWGNLRHYSLGMSWRGGPAFSRSSKLRKTIRRSWNIAEVPPDHDDRWGELGGPPGASLIADALLQVAYGFEKFFHTHYENLYDIRGHGSKMKFDECLDQVNKSGVAQMLPTKRIGVEGPFVYVDEWRGAAGRSLAVWRIENDTVHVVWPKDKDIFKSNKDVRDVSKCYTSSRSNGEFTSRCHDVIIFSAVTLSLLAVPALTAARRARRNRRRRRELESRQRNAATLVTYLVDRHSIKLLHEIGSGTFGRVHFAELKRPGHGTVVVAAKEPHESIANVGENEFLREACLLAPLCHKNVIRLVGVCLVDGPPMVLMEHALYLDLQRYLTERKYLIIDARLSGLSAARAVEVSDEALTRMAREAAAALQYLAAQRLVHRDVRAANCLVDKDRSLKLADFGMARKLADRELEYATTRRGLFPVLWMAPESLEQGVFSTASDVWALGVLFLEIVTLGTRPFGDWPPARVLRYVTEGGHAPLPPDISTPVRTVLLACWRRDAEARPAAEWVHRYLATNERAFTPAFLAATTQALLAGRLDDDNV